ncbi:MAG: hypothetical protein COA79_23415 [Planctomycetota bacterium]|nr:MAG: hypothetical protein COA79_23415 [Planctomycetota bacterium]
MTEKEHSSSEILIQALGELSSVLTDSSLDFDYKLSASLEIVRKVLRFDLSILFKIVNQIDDLLILEVINVDDPHRFREDLSNGKKVLISLSNPDYKFKNEVKAFETGGISNINVPGEGSDLIGYIYMPAEAGGGYLFGGDYIGENAGINESELSTFKIMCNLLSSIVMRSYYKQMAFKDALTGLYNSRFIRQELKRGFEKFRRNPNIPISVVMCDIDYFKKINDDYSHIQGDAVLQEVGELLLSQMRKSFDILGRYGGEEFLVIMEGVSRDDAMPIVERWCQEMENHVFKRIDEQGQVIKDEGLSVTMSFGVSDFNSSMEEAKSSLAQADKALYASKENGRNKVTLAAK